MYVNMDVAKQSLCKPLSVPAMTLLSCRCRGVQRYQWMTITPHSVVEDISHPLQSSCIQKSPGMLKLFLVNSVLMVRRYLRAALATISAIHLVLIRQISTMQAIGVEHRTLPRASGDPQQPSHENGSTDGDCGTQHITGAW
jgi:hypothetical protein